MTDTLQLSDDALVFGCSFLKNSGFTLAFGGEHAKMEITPRARAALDELLAANVIEKAEPWDQWPGREYYRGKVAIGPLMEGRNVDPFDDPDGRFKWTTFFKKRSPI